MLQRSFRFPTILGTEVKFVDMMGESFLTFRIPQQLLKVFISEEKQKILDLNNLGDLNSDWDNVRQEILDNHFKLVSNYTASFRHLNNLRERQDIGVSSWRNFKPSSLKTDKTLAFVTTNLHLQRLKVIDGTNEQGYDVVTFGAPSAHSMKYSKGGLRRLLGNLREAYFTQSGGDNRANRAKNKRIELELLKHAFKDICKNFKSALANNNLEEVIELSTKLHEKVNDLLKYYEMTFIIDSLVSLSTSRPIPSTASTSREEYGEKYTYKGLNDFQPESEDADDPECQVLRNSIESSVAQILKMINELNKESPLILNDLAKKSWRTIGEKTLDSVVDDLLFC
ncbi:type I inositol 3,4-bisphosphate 4-phosphatase-like [Dendronephthya gigantea]|uniref:type I inositol 3,4-bisphosphate 4-phosphatase-like n=1 Tax=Dendronephthya gigantea TaxID=151771 RepID=UPI00106B9897|nr:type I inositol 3,4-bisphosphate 4-phosphatase-like [Dendronephthya gigantea]